jgi:hypothetical protein
MAATCFNYLNYIAIFLLYLLGFYFVYKTYAQAIGFSVLFVVNTAFIFFLLSQIGNFNLGSALHLPYERQIAAFSIFIGLVFHFVAITLIIVMISKLKITPSSADGTPLGLVGQYKIQMDSFKENMLIVFSFIFILLLWLMYGMVPAVPFVQYRGFQMAFAFATITMSLFTIGLSIKQVIISNEFSKLQNRQI